MRVVVVAASGRTGALIVKELLKAGEIVVGTIRNPRHMADLVKQGVEVALLDLDKSPLADLEQTFKGADAVIFAAGSAEGESSAIDRKGVYRTVLAAQKAKVARYVAISALGSSTPVPKDFDSKEMKDYYAAKRAGDKRIRESGLEWTIIEPGGLGEGKPAGKIGLSETGIADKSISRADVAATVVAALKQRKTAGRTFQIVGGTTAIGAAIDKAINGPVPKPEDLKTGAKKVARKADTPAAKKAPAAKAKTAPAKKAAAKALEKKAPGQTAKKPPAKKTRRS